MIELEVTAAFAGDRVDKVVSTLSGINRARVSEAIDGGLVSVNGEAVVKASRRVVEGDVVSVGIDVDAPLFVLTGDSTVPFDVVHEDDDVLVVYKPAGVVVHPGTGAHTSTLVHGLLHRYPKLIELAVGDRDLRPGIVHRIDKGTSGLLMVARTKAATDALIAQLSAHTVERRYLALAWGRFESRAGMIDAAIGRSNADPTKMTVSAAGRMAVTHYEVAEQFDVPEPLTLVRCELETGRTHQIRVHLGAIGHPVVGDPIYGGTKRSFPIDRPFLHAQTLGFVHPTSGESLQFSCPLPVELQTVLDQLS
jgi:23S rRNA pseudouridine1911/1915/1917 synthase